jgi:ArsR family transcriptional regulator
MAECCERDTVEFGKVLADPTRLQIMGFCCCEWRSVGEITQKTGVSQPTVSHHLAMLRDAGLVEIRHEGKQTFYRLNHKQVEKCCGSIQRVLASDSQ